MAQKITNKTTDLQIGTVLKVINIKENTPYVLNKFYNITDGDGVGALFVGGYSDIEFTMHDLGNYFEHIATIDDIEDFESKALLLKQIFNQFKELSEDAGDEVSEEALINEAIAFLVKDEVYKCDEIELRFICDDMDITMVEQCSCCGIFISPDDECYSDNLNDGAALCDHCSIFDEENDMYIKTVHQDVIEEITGYKFSPHVGNVGSALEDFNHYLKNNELKFGVNEPESKKHFTNFIIDNTELNLCDCCQMIEKSDDLAWTDGQFFEDEEVAINFVNASYSNFAAICQNCLNKFISRTKLSLHEIVQRIKENKMIFRVGELVILKNVDLISNNMFAYIESLDEATQTYKLKVFENVVIKEEDLFDIANEAYIVEYNEFIKNKHVEKVDDLSDFGNDNKEHTIDMLVENFGFKDEFIEHLKSNDLPFSRFLTPKFKVGDGFKIHFNHYNDGEFTTHTISKIDTSFTEENEIVYWSDEFVYITESELEKQKNPIIDEDEALKDSILVFIFSDYVPTYSELINAGKIKPNWQLSEEYENYDYSLILEKVNERLVEFKAHLKALNTNKEKIKKSKKYGLRTYAEYGAPIELVSELQELDNIDDNIRVYNPELRLLLLQDSRNTQDFSSIEILVQDEIKYDELSLHLKSKLDIEHHDEVDKLIEAIKEAKSDSQTILHVYDC